jgi:hypothetical protein
LNRKLLRNRFSATFAPPFKIGAPSIVFGRDLLENVRMLADRVDHIEILLFHTPTLHHFPSITEIQAVNKMGDSAGLSFSVHLPTSLEIASRHREKRHASLKMVVELINLMNEVNPIYHILHIPVMPPTLTAAPGSISPLKIKMSPKGHGQFNDDAESTAIFCGSHRISWLQGRARSHC